MKQSIIAPSILAANFGNLDKDIEMLNNSEAEWIHIDVMDGVFVPNISFGFPILTAARKKTNKFCDVHLMIVEPQRYLEDFKKAGADGISVHVEGNFHLHSSISKIQALGMKAGVVLNPATPLNVLDNVLEMIDYVLIMSVNPGFGGQKFIESSVEKVKALKTMLIQNKSKALIEVDGGVTIHNAARLKEAGADILVAGSAVFNSTNPIEYIAQLKNCS